MLVVAAFPDVETGARAVAALRSHYEAELYTREAAEIPGETEDDEPGDIIVWAAVAGAIAGGAISILVQWWSSTIAYPLAIGGREPPAFFSYVPAAVAVAMFWSAAAAFLAFLWSCGLPRLHHPLFDAAAHPSIAEGASLVGIEVEKERVEAACAAARQYGARSTEVVGQ